MTTTTATPIAVCLNCGEDITGDVAEFDGLPGRTFCLGCIADLGSYVCWALAKTAPDSAWMTDPEAGTFVTGQEPTDAVCVCGAYITKSPVDGAWEDQSGCCGCGDGEHTPTIEETP